MEKDKEDNHAQEIPFLRTHKDDQSIQDLDRDLKNLKIEEKQESKTSYKNEDHKETPNLPNTNIGSMKEYWNSHQCHNHRERLAWMTGGHAMLKTTFSQVKNWTELHQWHQKNTPWLGNDQINLLMKSYHNEAKETKNISPNHQWMLEFNL